MQKRYEIPFENEHFIVVNKPSLELSVPSRMGDKDERVCTGAQLQHQLGYQLFPVHRLDFEVSGLLMFAKNQTAHVRAQKWFEEKIIRKCYFAQTELSDKFKLGDEFKWECFLAKGKKRAYEASFGKKSITIARVVSKAKYLSWELEPVTGRSHQLRYELFRHDLPIIGDLLYGSKHTLESGGIALKSFQLDFQFIDQNERELFQLPLQLIIEKKF